MMRLVALVIVLISWTSAKADIFIDIPISISAFLFTDVYHNPYDRPHQEDRSAKNSLAYLMCKDLALQTEIVRKISQDHRNALSTIQLALQNNDSVRQKNAEEEAARLLTRLKAAQKLLDIIEWLPIKGAVTILPSELYPRENIVHSDDPISRFLHTASQLGKAEDLYSTSIRSKVREAKTLEVRSKLPITARRETADDYYNKKTEPSEFEASFMPALQAWSTSVGRKAESFPITVTLGAPDITIALDLTQKQLCSAISEKTGELLRFELSMPSRIFGNQNVITTYRVGWSDSLKEAPEERRGREEGHMKALDVLFHELLEDIFDPGLQLYRISDDALLKVDGGKQLEGQYDGFWTVPKQIEVDGKMVETPRGSLRDALNTMNDELGLEGAVTSASVLTALTADNRYRGGHVERVATHDVFRKKDGLDFAEFALHSGRQVARIGFVAVPEKKNRIEVGFVIANGKLLYINSWLLLCGLSRDDLCGRPALRWQYT